MSIGKAGPSSDGFTACHSSLGDRGAVGPQAAPLGQTGSHSIGHTLLSYEGQHQTFGSRALLSTGEHRAVT